MFSNYTMKFKGNQAFAVARQDAPAGIGYKTWHSDIVAEVKRNGLASSEESH